MPRFRAALLLVLSVSVVRLAGAAGLWDQLYSPDIKTYAANLRAAGAPEETISVLIGHAVDQQFRAREQALQPSTASAQTLKTALSPERREELLQLRLEKNAVLRAALGKVPSEKVRHEWDPAALARLDATQRDLVRAIMDDYDAMIARINTESRGYMLDEDREKLRFLHTERSKDLQKILTEDEVLDFELALTNYGRTRLKLFEPTQAQLRTYLRLAKTNDLAFNLRTISSDALHVARTGLEKDLAAAWDPATYARYRRTTSSHYIPLANLVRRLNLDPQIAERLFDSTRRITEEGARLFREANPEMKKDRPLIAGHASTIYVSVPLGTAEQKTADAATAGIKALAEAHVTLARELLGEAGFRAYWDFARSWIDAMRVGNSVTLDFSLYAPVELTKS
jgi:hypothetical protein